MFALLQRKLVLKTFVFSYEKKLPGNIERNGASDLGMSFFRT